MNIRFAAQIHLGDVKSDTKLIASNYYFFQPKSKRGEENDNLDMPYFKKLVDDSTIKYIAQRTSDDIYVNIHKTEEHALYENQVSIEIKGDNIPEEYKKPVIAASFNSISLKNDHGLDFIKYQILDGIIKAAQALANIGAKHTSTPEYADNEKFDEMPSIDYINQPGEFKANRDIKDLIQKVPFSPEDRNRINQRLSVHKNNSATTGTNATSWIDTLLDYPWLAETKDKANIDKAKQIFNKKFYGMEDVKRRVLEEVAMRNFHGGNQGGILLFVGPPGVGKTAVGKTIAEVLGRKFVLRSLAGIGDPSKITGHDYTYRDAKSGIIIEGMIEAGTKNPVFFLDEMDKTGGANPNGINPKDALTAVLDPVQNAMFRDSFMDIAVDLSKVLFICTANRIEDFPPHLLSRTEIIKFDPYMPEEKREIAKRYLVPKLYKQYRISPEQIKVEEAAIKHIISYYTHEGGVRKLEQALKTLFRQAGVELLSDTNLKSVLITPDYVNQRLDGFVDKQGVTTTQPGEVHGMFYSDNGGGIMPIQTAVCKGRGEIRLTGSLGDVMKESAQTALSIIKQNDKLKLGIDPEKIKPLVNGEADIHIHYPDTATKKDGPSAGSSTFLSLWSLFSDVSVPPNVALTGEIDLTGRINPIGGIKEKITGAIDSGIKQIYLPMKNKNNFDAICKKQELFRKRTEMARITFVSSVQELIDDLKTNVLNKKS